MASDVQSYCYDGEKSFTVSKLKVKVGNQLYMNSTILSYKQEDGCSVEGKEPLLKYKSNIGGTITELLISEGDTVTSGKELLRVQPCTHPVIMKDMCAECGVDLRQLDREKFKKLTAATTFSMVHVVPELKVNLEQAEQLGKDDETRLLENKKLVLLVDLDQTLIHTTNDNIPQDLPDVHHFQLYGQYSPWYHTKLRPGTNVFLENVSQFYELHICTFGARLYAHKIAKILDPHGKFFSHRILSRDECFDPRSKMGNLKALFPRGDHMVCIIDDREDVWNFAPNVIHVKPYSYFRNTGDINAPSRQNRNVKCTLIKSTEVNNSQNGLKDTIVHDEDNEKNLNPPKIAINKSVSVLEPSVEKSYPYTTPDSGEGISQCEVAESYFDKGSVDKQEKVNTENNSLVESKIVMKSKSVIEEVMSDMVANVEVENQDFKNEVTLCDASKLDRSTKTDFDVFSSAGSSPPSSFFVDYDDDYLLYLEEILVKVHKTYYSMFSKMKRKQKRSIPDLRRVVPSIRGRVLRGVNIVFSSIIPTNGVPENHHLWTLAESLGAHVSRDLVLERTTHVVASKRGTAKVNSARRHGGIHLVHLDWLLCCAERWARADERVFVLPKDLSLEGDAGEEQLLSSPAEKPPRQKRPRSSNKAASKAKKSDRESDEFSERIFVEAGLSLSQEDIADMDREIDEACSGQDSDSSSSSSSSSVESLSSGDYPKGWGKRHKWDVQSHTGETSSEAESIGSVDEEMAEAVKREFGHL